MKSRLLACAVAGLACTFPARASAQVSGGDAGRAYGALSVGRRLMPVARAVPLDQITANVRAAGLQPLSRPVLRGAVYYVRAINPARAEMRVAIDARSGRVLSATRVAHEPPAPPAKFSEPGPAPQPYVSGHGYSEAPPADLPLEGRVMPPGRMPDAPAPKLENAPSPGPAKPVMVPIAPLE